MHAKNALGKNKMKVIEEKVNIKLNLGSIHVTFKIKLICRAF